MRFVQTSCSLDGDENPTSHYKDHHGHNQLEHQGEIGNISWQK